MPRTCWLRAAVLGANDGIVSTASLLLGVAAAGAPRDSILLAGVSPSVLRVMFWGALAMALTAAIGKLAGTVV